MNTQKDPIPCPFCGSGDVGGASGTVHCYKCKAEISVENANTDFAVELWNIRAPTPHDIDRAHDTSTIKKLTEQLNVATKLLDKTKEDYHELASAVGSMNFGPRHAKNIEGDDDPVYEQRHEWCEWLMELANKELKPKISISEPTCLVCGCSRIEHENDGGGCLRFELPPKELPALKASKGSTDHE